MTRRGFALITVLWLIAALGLVTGVAVSGTRLGMWTTRNRIVLTRAAWAREACHEILLGRYAENRNIRMIDTIDFGRGVWCRAVLENASGKLDLNAMPDDAWRAVLGNDTLADAALDWRDADDLERPLGVERSWYRANGRRPPRNGPFASVAELRYVRGFDRIRVSALEHLVTVRGTPETDLNAAPTEVLRTIPGMTPEAIDIVRDARSVGHRITGIDDLLDRLSPPARTAILDQYQDFSRRVVFEPIRFVEYVEGWVRGTSLTSRGWLTVVPVMKRLAVIRREME